MAKLSLHWPRDLDGYRIERPQGGGTSRAARTILGSADPASIVRNGGKLFSVDVLQFAGLYERLADHETNERGALGFVSKYGFLREQRSEHVDDICNQIRVVRSLLRLKKSRDWNALRDWMIDYAKTIRLNPEVSAGDPPELFFRPVSLKDAIYLQFLQDLSTSANIRMCKRDGCGEWFYFGPGTRHRNTAEYCSPKCQKADAYAKSKGDKR